MYPVKNPSHYVIECDTIDQRHAVLLYGPVAMFNGFSMMRARRVEIGEGSARTSLTVQARFLPLFGLTSDGRMIWKGGIGRELSRAEKDTRMNIRNFLLAATGTELLTEMKNSIRSGDTFRAECISELYFHE